MRSSWIGNPFPGLRPFERNEEHLYFGRENQVDTLVDTLRSAKFVAVVGTSGCGKTSLINCGLQPALHRGLMSSAGTDWQIVQFRPGSRPIAEMATALACNKAMYPAFFDRELLPAVVETSLKLSKRGLVEAFRSAQLPQGANLLVVVDQFEELFRYRAVGNRGEPERNQEALSFVELLLEARREASLPIYIVLTMRSDFLGNCAEFPGLPEAINDGQYLVPRMTRDERRPAIQGPVRVGHAQIDSVLLTRLLNDVGDNPDQLSILQHALNRTWTRWQEEGSAGPLELRHYEGVGTMQHALDQHAKQAFAELGKDDQRIAEKLFKALTDKGTDARGIRRPTEFGKLCALTGASAEQLTRVIDVFREPSRSFLMPPLPRALLPDTAIDISHESLMRVWEQLKGWVEEEALSAQIYLRLADAGRRYALGQAMLWGGPDLRLSLQWRDKADPNPTWASLYGGGYEQAMSFLAESEAAAQAAAREKAEARQRALQQAHDAAAEARLRAQKEASAARRLRWALAAVVLCFFAAGVLAVYAYRQATYARGQEADAKEARKKADIQTGIAQGASRDLKTAEQKLVDENADLQQTVLDEQREKAAAEANEKKANEATAEARFQARRNFSHELAAEAGTVQDPSLKLLLATEAVAVTYEVNGKAEPEAEARLRQVVQARQSDIMAAHVMRGHASNVTAALFSQDGSEIVTAGTDGTVRIWDANAGVCKKTEFAPGDALRAAAVSPDGRWIAAGGTAKVVHLWDRRSDTETVLSGAGSVILALRFSPDSRHLDWASADGTAREAVAGGSGESRVILSGLRGTSDLQTMSFSPDLQLVAALQANSVAKVWSMATPGTSPQPAFSTFTGDESQLNSQVYRSQATAVHSVSFSASGNQLLLGSTDGHLSVWTPRGKANTGGLATPFSPVNASASDGRRKHVAFAGESLQDYANNPSDQGQTVLPSAGLWDTSRTDGRIVRLYDPSGEVNSTQVFSLDFNRNGDRVVGAGADRIVRVWDVATGRQLLQLADTNQRQVPLAISSDGRFIAAVGDDGVLRLLDGVSSLEIFSLANTGSATNAAFTPDGSALVGIGLTGGFVWDTATGNVIKTFPGKVRPSVLVVGPGAKTAATMEGASLSLWDIAAGKKTVLAPYFTSGRTPPMLALSPDGSTLAASPGSGSLNRWDVAASKPLPPLTLSAGVTGLAFAPDNQRLAAAVAGGEITLWNFHTGRQLPSIFQAVTEVSMLFFNHSGSRLAELARDGANAQLLRVIDMNGQGDPIDVPLTGYPGRVAFEKDAYLLSVPLSSNVRTTVSAEYALDPATLLAVARRLTIRGWTQPECRQYLHQVCPAEAEAMTQIAAANAALRLKDWAGARQSFADAERIDPMLRENKLLDENMEIGLAKASVLLDRGRDAAVSGNADAAADQFTQAAQANPRWHFQPRSTANWLTSWGLIAQARNQARSGQAGLAVASFDRARALDANLKIDSRSETDRVAARGVLAEGVTLAEAGKFEAATATFVRAEKLDMNTPNLSLIAIDRKESIELSALIAGELNGENVAAGYAALNALKARYPDASLQPEVVMRSELERMTSAAQQDALRGDVYRATAIQSYRKIAKIYAGIGTLDPDNQRRAHALNEVCWFGSLSNQAASVLPECEQAVALSGGNPVYRDSRGLAYALTGRKKEAIADFQAEADHPVTPEIGKERLGWIEQLRKGVNPFTTEKLNNLVRE